MHHVDLNGLIENIYIAGGYNHFISWPRLLAIEFKLPRMYNLFELKWYLKIRKCMFFLMYHCLPDEVYISAVFFILCGSFLSS